jgi:hypothetical protein
MSRETPEQVLNAIVDGINTGNLDTSMTLHEPEAAFAAQPGTLAHGLPSVRESLAAFVAMKGTLDLQVTRILEALVVHGNRAGRRGGDPDGPQRGCAASSGGRFLALRDRQPLGNGLTSRGRTAPPRNT